MSIPHVFIALLSLVFILSGVAGLFEGNRLIAIAELAVGASLLYLVFAGPANHPRS